MHPNESSRSSKCRNYFHYLKIKREIRIFKGSDGRHVFTCVFEEFIRRYPKTKVELKALEESYEELKAKSKALWSQDPVTKSKTIDRKIEDNRKRIEEIKMRYQALVAESDS